MEYRDRANRSHQKQSRHNYNSLTSDTPGYDGSEYLRELYGNAYDLSGIVGTGEFPGIGYEEPGYSRLSYDDPRYDEEGEAT